MHLSTFKTIRIFSFFFFIFVFLTTVLAGSGIDDGWEFFAKNDFANARKSFESELSGPEAARANLALSLVGAAESSSGDESFRYYSKFYDLAKDPTLQILGLWSMSNGERTEEELAFLNKLITNEKGTLKALALQSLGSHYYLTNDRKKSQSYYAQVGAVDQWNVLGSFENISESGFNKDFGALDHPEASHLFKDKRNIDVKWFDIKAPRYDNWVDLDYFVFINNAIIYSQNFCQSPIDQVVQFRLGVSGSVKVWVNDNLLFAEDHERNNDLDSYVFTAKLHKGYNRILIQSGESEVGNCNFLLRLTDDQGENISGLNYTTDLQSYPKDANFNTEILEDQVANHFKKKIELDERNLENHLTLIQYYNYSDQTFEAKAALKEARSVFPDCSYLLVHQLLANSGDGNTTMVNTIKEELKQKDPDNMLAMSLLYSEALDREDYDEAELLLDKIEAKEGRSSNVLKKRIGLTSVKEERESMFSLINEGFKTYPDHYTFVYYKFLLLKDIDKNPRAAIKVLRKYLEDHYSEEAQTQLASAYFSISDASRGMNSYEKLVENNPIATGYYARLASITYSLGLYSQSAKYTQECINIAPYAGAYYETLAKTYTELGEKSKAKETYEKALYYNAYNYDAREQLRQLNDLPDVFSHFEEPDVYEIFEKSASAEDFPEDNSLVLLHEVQKVLYDGGGSEEKHFVVIKMFNSAGVDAWKEYDIPLQENQNGILEKIEVIKADGSKIAAENNGTYVVFSNLESGDAVHLNYRVRNYYSGKLAKHSWGDHYFSYFYPIACSKFSVLMPQDQVFNYELANANIDVETNTVNIENNRLMSWEATDVPSLKYETYMPSTSEVATVLHYSTFPDWKYISDWYADLAQAKAKVDFEVKELEKELFSDTKNLTQREKVETIYDYIVNDIHYRSVSFIQSGLIPQKASATISARQGDCKDVSTLFVALCRTQDIPAHLVLVNTRDNGQKSMMLPSINFNHCIAKVQLDEEEYVIELTSENLPFSSQWGQTVGAFTLDIPIDQAPADIQPELLYPTSRQRNEVYRESKAHFEGNKIFLEKKTVKTGASAASMRDSYESVGDEQRHKYMEDAVAHDHPGVKLLSVSFGENIATVEPELNYEYSYEIEDVFTEISGLQIFEVPWADAFEMPDFISNDDRQFPVDLWVHSLAEKLQETIVIDIPEGKKLSEIPKNISHNTLEFNYSLTYTLEGQKLTLDRQLEYLKDVVAVDRFNVLKEVIGKIGKADRQQLAFVNK